MPPLTSPGGPALSLATVEELAEAAITASGATLDSVISPYEGSWIARKIVDVDVPAAYMGRISRTRRSSNWGRDWMRGGQYYAQTARASNGGDNPNFRFIGVDEMASPGPAVYGIPRVPGETDAQLHDRMALYLGVGAWTNGDAQPLLPVAAPSRDTLRRVEVVVRLDGSARQALAMEAEALLGYQPLRLDAKAPGVLRAALARLEIQVLEESSVNAYKEQMVRHYASHAKMADPTWRLTDLGKYAQPVPEFVLHKACQIKRELPSARFYVDQLAVDPFLIVSMTPIADLVINVKRGLDPETQAYVEVWDEPKFQEKWEGLA